MITKGVSHIALGVRDMERSLEFYRDRLGFEVVSDQVQDIRSRPLLGLYREPHERRRAVTLRWRQGDEREFLVLSEHTDKPVSGEAIGLDQIGVHHFAFWVEGLQRLHEELVAQGVEFVIPPTTEQTPVGPVTSAFLRDPDGILVQLDEAAL